MDRMSAWHRWPDLSDTAVIVTGGAGCVGEGICRRFALAGADVIVHHHRAASPAADRLVASLEESGRRAVRAHGDVRDPRQCDAIIGAAIDAFGRLDAVVNAAGIQPVEPLESMTVAQWREVVEVNLTGAFAITQAAATAMRDQGRGGSITHIASVEATLPASGHAHYASSKAAVLMHARAAALELGAWGIRVNTVSPGLIDGGDLAQRWPQGRTSWMRAAPLGRTGNPGDIGDACVFLASPLAGFITGHNLVVDGGMSTVPAW